LTASEVAAKLQKDKVWASRIEHIAILPAREAHFAEAPDLPSPRVQQVLKRLGIEQLYSHQAEAVSHLLAGRNTGIVTSTASGKTLCYNLAVLEAFERQRTSRALYVFPTKALAQDQLRKLRELEAELFLRAATYDGDTPRRDRRDLRAQAPVILTNPDMLHLGILPNDTLWTSLFSHLKYVVFDEVHQYRGLFGSHVANVIRRLRRVAEYHGASPTFVFCSATVANARELIEGLLGESVELIEQDGSPAGERTLLFWNPRLMKRADGLMRRNYLAEARDLVLELMRDELRSITFCQARVLVELLLRSIKEATRQDRKTRGLAKQIRPYRSGYLPEERREIEQQLFDGELLSVVSTSALEVGIDVGGLDAALLLGFPGSLASFWQQFGRAGRGAREALGVLMAAGGPLDQYYLKRPEALLSSPTERAVVNPRNRFVLAAHLLCAAHEAPLREQDMPLFGPTAEALADVLAEAGYLSAKPERKEWYWTGLESPAAEVNLRSASGQAFEIHDEKGQLIGTVDAAMAPLFLHEGAVYLHQGISHVVQKLDFERRTAYVRREDVSFFTRAMTRTETEILAEEASWEIGLTRLAFGELVARGQVVGYSKLRAADHSTLETLPLELPPSEYETFGLWFSVAKPHLAILAERGCDPLGALHALEHALIALSPAFVSCEAFVFDGASSLAHPQLAGEAGLFVYDAYPGGSGLAEELAEQFEQVLAATRQHIAECPCGGGCPACIYSPRCGSGNQPLDKAGAILLADLAVGIGGAGRGGGGASPG